MFKELFEYIEDNLRKKTPISVPAEHQNQANTAQNSWDSTP